MLCTLNANKAVGPDIISNRMLVSVKEEISKPLCSLFNKSLREKVFLPKLYQMLCLYQQM
jgi:hypothetical protein